MSVVGICIVGIVAVALAVTVKNVRPEFSLCIGLATALFIGMYLLWMGQGIRQQIVDILGEEQLVYLSFMLKVMGIAYVCDLASSLCKDAGFSSVAGQIDLAGRLGVLAIALPVLATVVQELQEVFAL